MSRVKDTLDLIESVLINDKGEMIMVYDQFVLLGKGFEDLKDYVRGDLLDRITKSVNDIVTQANVSIVQVNENLEKANETITQANELMQVLELEREEIRQTKSEFEEIKRQWNQVRGVFTSGGEG